MEFSRRYSLPMPTSTDILKVPLASRFSSKMFLFSSLVEKPTPVQESWKRPTSHHSLGPPKKRLRTKKVRFDDTKNTVKYRHLIKEDLQNAWIQEDEYQAIREDNVQTILAVKAAKGKMSALDSQKFCIRGLEEQVSVFLFKSERTRQRSLIRRIVQEQNALKKMGCFDPNFLKGLSMTLSREARTKAVRLAFIDAASKY